MVWSRHQGLGTSRMPYWFSCAFKNALTTDWNKHDERLMKAAERGDVEKISSILAKKGVNPTKLDVEGRSVFHVVASKGNLDCLNTILIHGVDIVATDAAGRNALHLAAKYGHVLCLQKLLQYNCPTENVDLQGRTALHDAAMSDCVSSVQLLCDHGALVNARDADGRSPLVLATQMCRPTICQLLLDRGADVNVRDKQNRTALMLGCEYGCKDAVEVLLKNSADVNLVDALGHDCSYYARIGDSVEILTLLKPAIDESNKAIYGVVKKGQPVLKVTSMRPKWSEPNVFEEESFRPRKDLGNVQELESENENLKARLREIQEEHELLLDRVNELQLQLNEEQMIADDLESEKVNLKRLLTAKEKQQEESLQMLEALTSKLRFYECDLASSGNIYGNRKEESLHRHDTVYSAESQHMPGLLPSLYKSRSMMRPLELLSPSPPSASEMEALKQELRSMKSCCETARGDVSRLQLDLSHKAAECEALVSGGEKTKRESDQQVKQLEDALRNVQKRMFDSEGKVKQMQTHFLALKDHLTNEAAVSNNKLPEELKDQLKDMKVKYEGASAEVAKLRNQLKQNELLVEEFRREEAQLVEENKKLQKELVMFKMECEKKERRVSEAEGQMKGKAATLGDRYEKMKHSLSSEVEEKAWKLAEMEKDRDKLDAEVQRLRAELESQRAQFSKYLKPEEHRLLRERYEQRSKELERAHSELKQTNQAVQKEIERDRADNSLLKQQMEALKNEIQVRYVPLKVNEDMKKASDLMIQELNTKLAEITQKYHKCKAEAEKLLEEKNSLRETMCHYQAVYVPPEKYEEETGALQSTIADLKRQFAELGQRYKEEKAKSFELLSKNAVLKDAMKKQYVPVATHEETKTVLNSMLVATEQELSDLKARMESVKQRFVEASEENGALQRKQRALESQIECEFVSTEAHNDKVAALKGAIRELQGNNAETLAKYQRSQEEVTQLHAEIEAQKIELDTIQECIKSKYAPLSSLEEREGNFEATVKGLKSQLMEQEEQLRRKEEEMEKLSQENDKLRTGFLGIQNDLQQNYILAEKSYEMERMFARKMDDLNKQLRELQQKFTEIKHEKERLLEESARQQLEALNAQSQYVPVEQFDALKKKLDSTTEELKGELSSRAASWQQEVQKVQELQHSLAHTRATSVPLVEHAQLKERLEGEAAALKASLKEKEGENQARREEISKLQMEIQSVKQSLRELEGRKVVEMSDHKLVTSKLGGQIRSKAEKLAALNKRFDIMSDKASQVNMGEIPAKEEEVMLEPRSFRFEQEIMDQKERCDKSLSTIAELHMRIQESGKQVEAKDNKITELLNDVERLKQALSSLSQLTYKDGVPIKRQNQQIETLQNHVKTLEQQLADAERQHQEVISIYRTHLLSAVQGHMDEDVQAALLQIIHMRQGLVC